MLSDLYRLTRCQGIATLAGWRLKALEDAPKTGEIKIEVWNLDRSEQLVPDTILKYFDGSMDSIRKDQWGICTPFTDHFRPETSIGGARLYIGKINAALDAITDCSAIDGSAMIDLASIEFTNSLNAALCKDLQAIVAYNPTNDTKELVSVGHPRIVTQVYYNADEKKIKEKIVTVADGCTEVIVIGVKPC